MPRFKLKEKTLKVADMDVHVVQLTHKQRNEFVTRQADDKYKGPAIIAELGTVEPKLTAEEWAEEPSDIVELIVDEIMELSGMKPKKKEPGEKEPDAG